MSGIESDAPQIGSCLSPLSEFRDVHKGRRAWLVCPGSSLDLFDQSVIKPDDIVMATNHACLALSRWDYSAASDGAVAEMNCYERFACDPDRYSMHMNNDWIKHPIFQSSWENAPWRETMWKKARVVPSHIGNKHDADISPLKDELIEGENVAHRACHLLMVMGCSPIVLVGCDCQYFGGYKYFQDQQPGTEPWAYTKVSCGRTVGGNTDSGGFGVDINTADGDRDGAMHGAYNFWKRIKEANPDAPIVLARAIGRLSTVFPTIG